MNDETNRISRRNVLQGAASLVGGTLVAAHLGPLASRATAAAADNATPVFFDVDQFSMIESMVDLIIPETDTPGAVMAGVHYFIDLMLDEWASDARQSRYRQGLQAIDARAAADSYLSGSPAERLDLLRTLDREAFADGAPDSFFREFKKMVLFAYYSSEEGATLELQYEPMPGDYKACVPIDDIGRAWFWLGFSHGL
jgi:hypothetical protein